MIRLLLLLSACIVGSAVAAPPNADKAPVEILAADFGLFDARVRGELALDPSDIVPNRVGQRYGWIIEVRTTKRSLSVREEYLLPNRAKPAATADPLAETLDAAAQRRSQVSQRQLVPVGGTIYGEWEIGPNEPSGRRRLQVVIEGEVAASFEYEVVPLRPAPRR